MGLLGGFLDDPTTQLAVGLLGGQSPNLGVNIAQAMQFAAAQQKAQEEAKQKRAMLDLQMQQHQMQLEDAKRTMMKQSQMDALGPQFFGPQSYPQGMTGDDQGNAMPPLPPKQDFQGYTQALMGIDPKQGLALQAQLAQMNAPHYQKLGEGDVLIDPKNPAKPVAMGAPKLPTGLVLGPNGERQVDPQYLEMQKAIRAAGAPKINIDNKQESAFASAFGKQNAEDYGKLMAADAGASSRINKLTRLEGLLASSGQTGKLTPATMELKAAAESLGFKVDPKLPFQQAAQALSNEIALELRNPSGGAGMPGALSDRDREFLQNMVPNLAKTSEGNKMLLETAKKLAKREKEVAALARQYRTQTGRFDEGFYQLLGEYSAKNPLFPEASAPASGGWSAQRVQ